MKLQTTLLLAGTVLGTPLSAQSPYTLTAVTDFGVVASDGVTTNIDSVPAGTVFSGLRQTVQAGTDPLFQIFFNNSVRTNVFRLRNGDDDPGVRFQHQATLNNPPTQGFFGTSSSPAAVAMPQPGPQRVRMEVAVPAGTVGDVFIEWSGVAAASAALTFEIDVDGDGVPEATGDSTLPNPNGGPSTSLAREVVIPVVAGANGISIDILQSAFVGPSQVGGFPGSGQTLVAGNYNANLSVFFREQRPQLNCTITPQPGACALQLAGQAGMRPDGAQAVELQVTGLPSLSGVAFGAFVVGPLAATPFTLPGQCPFIVGGGASQAIFPNGQATQSWQFPVGAGGAADFFVQAVFLANPISTTNALRIVCM